MIEKIEKCFDATQVIGKKAKKKLFGVIYSRTAVVLLLLIIQLLIVIYAFMYIESFGNYMYGISVLLSVIAVVYIINDKGSPEFKLTWLIFIMFMPVMHEKTA